MASSSVEGRKDGKVAGGGEGEREARVARMFCLVGVKARSSPCFWIAGRTISVGPSSAPKFDSESELDEEELEEDDGDDDDLAEEMAILEVFGTGC